MRGEQSWGMHVKRGDGGDLVHNDMSLLSGLVLRKVFLYVIKIRQRRERYHGGIKAIGEHMHVVTKTMSDAADRQQQPPKGSSSSSSSSNNNNNNNNNNSNNNK